MERPEIPHSLPLSGEENSLYSFSVLLTLPRQHLFEEGRRGVGGAFSEEHQNVPPFSVFSSLFSYLMSLNAQQTAQV